MFSDLASRREGGLSEGTTGGAAEDLWGEVRAPQSLSGEKREGDWEASRGGATLTLTPQVCENRADTSVCV